MTTSTTRTLEIGALCDPISKKLAGVIGADDGRQLDLDNDAITRCHLMGYMPDSTTSRARKRLLKKCQAAASRWTARTANSAEKHEPQKI